MLALFLALTVQAAEPSEVRSGAADARTLTIYRDDLAFVTETYRVDLPAGRSRLVFEGVNDRMVPQTAVLTAFDGVTLERNFDAGLLTPATLFRSLVGETATLTRTNPGSGEVETIQAAVVAAEQGVVLRTPDGFETLDCTGLPQDLAAAQRPDGLVSVPELSVIVDAAEGGPRELTLRYLASGLGWSADYVLTVGNAEEPAALRGWLTFTNGTADRFDDVPAAIVAGSLQRTGDTVAPTPDVPYYWAACWPQGTTKGPFPQRSAENPYLLGHPQREAAEERLYRQAAFSPEAVAEDAIAVTGMRSVATEERFGDYRLYRPPGPLTLTPYRTKQVRFLDEAGVDVERRYDVALRPWEVANDVAFRPATSTYVVDNEKDGTLARALPAGTVRLMTEADGDAFYLGQDDIRDLAIGLPVEVEAGQTGEVSIETRWRPGRTVPLSPRAAWTVTVVARNALPDLATVRLTLPDWTAYHTDFEASGADADRLSGQPSPTWDLTVPANGERTVELRLSWAE